MLTALGPTPIVIVMRHTRPGTAAKWIHTRPCPARPAQSKRIRLSRGVWIIRTQHWVPTSALDSATEVPEPEVVAEQQYHYSPPDWTTQGLCSTLSLAESDPMFFGIEVREAPGRLIAAANAARKICHRCPVKAACLTEALLMDERYGVWGGTSGRQREKLRTRMVAGATVPDLVAEMTE